MGDNRRQVRWLFVLSVSSIILAAFLAIFLRFASQENKPRWHCEIPQKIIEGSGVEEVNRKLLQASKTLRLWWLFTRHQLQRLQRLFERRSPAFHERIQRVLRVTFEHGVEYHRVIQLQLEMIGDEEARYRENQALSNLVYKKLYRLQNPKNCSSAPTLVFNLTNIHGFASGVHDVLWCFMKAFQEGRRLLLTTSSWHYAPDGWETAFQPLSDTCPSNLTSSQRTFCPTKNDDASRHLMRTLPADFGPRIINVQGNPLAWFHGQLLAYLLRPNERLLRHIRDQRRNILKPHHHRLPFVGVHVRRTDKIGNEARFHHLDEYIQHVEEFYRVHELSSNPVPRRIFLSTDDPHVLQQCSKKFPAYSCLHQSGSAETAQSLQTRYSNSSLWSVLTDLFLLAEADYLVCTFSSGLCRLAFELMHAAKRRKGKRSPIDVSQRALSLDVPHHYAWVLPLPGRAQFNHQAKNVRELDFEHGELLLPVNEYSVTSEALRGRTSNGLAERLRSRDKKKGDIPIYKTVPIYEYIDFPTKPETFSITPSNKTQESK